MLHLNLVQFGLIKCSPLLPRAWSRGERFQSLLLATVMGTNHHVAVRGDVQTGSLRFVPTDPDLRSAIRSSSSSSSAGVVFLQVTDEGLPASAYAYHHVTLIQHLQRGHQTVQSQREAWEIKSAYIFWLMYCLDVYEFSIVCKKYTHARTKI